MKRQYVALPTCDAFHASNAFVRLIMGPFGSGKSVAMVMENIIRAERQRPNADGVRRSRAAIIRNTYPELVSTTLKTWQEWLPESVAPVRRDVPITSRIRKKLADGTTMEFEALFLALNQPKDRKKLESLDLTWAWVNEAREIERGIFDQVRGRVGRFPPKAMGGFSWSGVFGDTNPPDTRHWYYKAAEIERPEGWEFFRQPGAMIRNADGTYSANPLAENVANHELGYTYWQRMIPGASQDWVDVHVLGQYGNVWTGQPVYAGSWSAEKHAAARPLGIYGGLPIYLGWDFGLTPACVIAQVAPTGQIRVLREMVCTDGGLRNFVERVVRPVLATEFPTQARISTCDPAGAQRSQVDEMTCVGELARLGIPTQPAYTNVFSRRRDAVLAVLNRNIGDDAGFVLDPACKMLREGFDGGYQFGRVQSAGVERYMDAPVKNEFSHCVAEGTLIATARGNVPIERVAIGDAVWTPLGWCNVLWSGRTDDDAQVYEITASNGATVMLTGDHRVFADSHWTRADALRYNQILHCIGPDRENTAWEGQGYTSRKCSTASRTTENRQDTTRRRGAHMAERGTCTAMCGSFTMGRSRVDVQYTTGTATAPTTTLPTSNFYPARDMPRFIPANAYEQTRIVFCAESLPRVRRRAGGTVALRGWLGTKSTASALGLDETRRSIHAHDAVDLTRHCAALYGVGFAARRARPQRALPVEWTTKPENAPFAGPSFGRTSTESEQHAQRVALVRRCRARTRVYDLTVDRAHCFYANGILVHNCHDALQYCVMGMERQAVAEQTPRAQARPEVVSWG